MNRKIRCATMPNGDIEAAYREADWREADWLTVRRLVVCRRTGLVRRNNVMPGTDAFRRLVRAAMEHKYLES